MGWTTPADWDFKEAPGSAKMNQQVRDNLAYLKAMLPAGVMMPYGGETAPAQWLLCDGSAVSRSTYADLFSAIGVLYGTGDGSTTFNLPNLKGKIPIGKDAAQSEFDVVGESGGEKTHLLTSAESGVPAHAHPPLGAGTFMRNNGAATANTGVQGGANALDATTGNNSAANASSAHNNLQPYLVTQYIIKY